MMKVQSDVALDILTRDGETAVLLLGKVVRLSVIGAAIFEMAKNPVGLDELASALGERFGEPEGTTILDRTTEAVAGLIRLGALVHVC